MMCCAVDAWSERLTRTFVWLAVASLTLAGCGHGQPDQPKNQTASPPKTGQLEPSQVRLQLSDTNCLLALDATITPMRTGDCRGVAHCVLDRNCKSDTLLVCMIEAHDALAVQMPPVVLWSGIDVWVYPQYATEHRKSFWIGRLTQETRAEGKLMPLLSDQTRALWQGNSFSDWTNERGKDTAGVGPGVRWSIREYPLWSLRNGDTYRWGLTETKRRKIYAKYVDGEPDSMDARKRWEMQVAASYDLPTEPDRKWDAELKSLYDWPGKLPPDPTKRSIDFGPHTLMSVIAAEGHLKSWPFGSPR